MSGTSQTLSGTCVAICARGVLLLGKSGAGKSDMALRLMDRGARLVADDQVLLERHAENIIANSPPNINGLLEIRDVGIFRFQEVNYIPVSLVIRFGDRSETERLPSPEFYECLGVKIPLLHMYPFDASAAIKIEMSLASLKDSSMMVGAFKD